MPMYDMHCDQCNLDYEVIMPSDDKASPCPKCGYAEPIRRFPSQRVTRVEGPKGVIHDERQIWDVCGKNWRNPKNHTRQGGDRKRLYWV